MKNNKLKYFIFIISLICFIKYESIFLNINVKNKAKNIGIIGYINDNNIGNQLIKYSMSVLLKKLGFNATLISLKRKKKINIKFLRKYLNLSEINSFSDINQSDYNFIIVNSDQVWAYNFGFILEVGFLSFAKNWNNTKKFVYAASLGYERWTNSTTIINKARNLVKQFSGISVREEQSINIIYKYLGIKPQFVLDPTFLIEKDDYLRIVKNYETKLDKNKNYFCSYILDESNIKHDYIQNVSKILNFSIIDIKVEEEDFVEKFLFSINICKSIITDSFHGTVFSIIFKKPFLAFINKERGQVRFSSLSKIFQIENRFIYPKKYENADLNNFTEIPNINITNFELLKKKSLDFIKRNLFISK